MGIPTKEVLPKPAVKIKQPINFLDQPYIFPNVENIRKDKPKAIHATDAGSNKSQLKLILGK